jgi:hypothetical protein
MTERDLNTRIGNAAYAPLGFPAVRATVLGFDGEYVEIRVEERSEACEPGDLLRVPASSVRRDTPDQPAPEAGSKCASCYRPPTVLVTFASPDPEVDGRTELACDMCRAMYRPGAFFPGFPAYGDYAATSGFTVTSVESLIDPDPAKVAEISTTISTFLRDAGDRAQTGAR